MSVDLTIKQQNYINYLTSAYSQLSSAMQIVDEAISQWNAMAYASGASPSGNNITDDVAGALRPSLNAGILNSAIGALVSVQTVVNSNSGYLEALRP